MDKKQTHYLSVRYSTSKGKDTYDMVACVLKNAQGGKRLAYTAGYGYCMTSTVFAEWINNNFKSELQALDPAELYGLRKSTVDGQIYMQGACGECSIRNVLESLGYSMTCTLYQRKGDLRAYTIAPKEVTHG
jgi:hypothetical protein